MENTQLTLLNIRQVTERISLSKSTIYRRLDHKDKLYDPTFPRPLKMGEITVRWLENDINTWITKMINEQRLNIA